MAKHILCHLCEDTFVAEYQKLAEQLNAMRKELEDYFLPLTRCAIQGGDIEGARQLVKRCPDDVVRCFMLDTIRQRIALPSWTSTPIKTPTAK